jgi:hypothetical protein
MSKWLGYAAGMKNIKSLQFQRSKFSLFTVPANTLCSLPARAALSETKVGTKALAARQITASPPENVRADSTQAVHHSA